jgi:hypothetical protein
MNKIAEIDRILADFLMVNLNLFQKTTIIKQRFSFLIAPLVNMSLPWTWAARVPGKLPI